MVNKKLKREINTFEDEQVAKEWIKTIEHERGDTARRKFIFPKLSSWIKRFHAGTLLDIGAGQGIASKKLAFKNLKYIGVEPSIFLVRRARKLYFRKRVRFFVGNAYNLPVPSKSVDGAFSIGVWFHIKNLRHAARELARVLKKEGRFYIFTANPAAYVVWESFFAKHGKYKKRGKMISGKIGATNWYLSSNIFYFHKLTEILRSLEVYDLRVANIETFGFDKYDKVRGLWMGIEGYKGHKKF